MSETKTTERFNAMIDDVLSSPLVRNICEAVGREAVPAVVQAVRATLEEQRAEWIAAQDETEREESARAARHEKRRVIMEYEPGPLQDPQFMAEMRAIFDALKAKALPPGHDELDLLDLGTRWAGYAWIVAIMREHGIAGPGGGGGGR